MPFTWGGGAYSEYGGGADAITSCAKPIWGVATTLVRNTTQMKPTHPENWERTPTKTELFDFFEERK